MNENQRRLIRLKGLDGEQLFVDVGQCRQTCSSHKTKIHRKEFEAYLKANATVDPVQVPTTLMLPSWNAMGLRNGQIFENQTLNLNVK